MVGEPEAFGLKSQESGVKSHEIRLNAVGVDVRAEDVAVGSEEGKEVVAFGRRGDGGPGTFERSQVGESLIY